MQWNHWFQCQMWQLTRLHFLMGPTANGSNSKEATTIESNYRITQGREHTMNLYQWTETSTIAITAVQL